MEKTFDCVIIWLFFLLLILIFRYTWTTVSSLNSAKGAMLRIGTRKRDARHVRVWKIVKKGHGYFKIQVNGVGPKAVATDPSPNKTMGLLRNHTVMDRRMSRHTFGEICTTPQIAILNKKQHCYHVFRESSACKVNWYWSVGNDEPRQRFALRYANFKRKCFIDKVIRVKLLMFAKNVCEPTGATAWQNGCFFWNTTILVPKRSPKTVWRDVFSTFQDNNKRKHKTNFNNKSDKTHLLFFLDSSCYMFSVHVLMHSTYIHIRIPVYVFAFPFFHVHI